MAMTMGRRAQAAERVDFLATHGALAAKLMTVLLSTLRN